jgi:hypothetical protein
MKRRTAKKKNPKRFDEFKDFVSWAQGRGAQAVKIGDVEIIFPGKPERVMGFQMPTDPYGWDFD